jgi:hypothetical protein
MIGKTIEKYAGVLYKDEEILNNNKTENEFKEQNYLSNDVNEAKVMIATSLALLVGIIHVRVLWFKVIKITKTIINASIFRSL